MKPVDTIVLYNEEGRTMASPNTFTAKSLVTDEVKVFGKRVTNEVVLQAVKEYVTAGYVITAIAGHGINTSSTIVLTKFET